TEHLSRSGENHEERRRSPQLYAVRFVADRRPVRSAHISLYRSEELERPHGTRGFDLEDRRRPALLPAPARPEGGRCGVADRQWILQARVSRAADGVRRRGAKTTQREPGRQRWIKGHKRRMSLLEI